MTYDRRDFLRTSGLAFAGLSLAGIPGFARRALATERSSKGRVLVTLFQRGAVDGLSMIPPVADPRYFTLRPTIALPRSGEGAPRRLDDTFGLHPSLSGLGPLWDAGSLAVVHAVGSPDPTRSHFDAQDYLDSGTPGRKSTADGWLNRALQFAKPSEPRPLRAVAMQPLLPRSLSGRAPALAMGSLKEFSVRDDSPRGGLSSNAATSGFESMYQSAVDTALRGAGSGTFEAERLLKEARPERLQPKNGARYPDSELGRRLNQIAQLIVSDMGLELAATDCGGWDTHAGQGADRGRLANRLKDLGDSLAAFAQDLGERMADVCVVTMTEFGRTVRENGTRGTDHGHGSVMLVLGAGVKGRRVVGAWRGLAESELFEGRDLPVTTDHREVLGEVLRGHLGVTSLVEVFPGWKPAQRLGLFG